MADAAVPKGQQMFGGGDAAPVKFVAPMLMHLESPIRCGSTTTTGKPASSNALSEGLAVCWTRPRR
jgi:hypothetical protein